jgi:hypothetical protein
VPDAHASEDAVPLPVRRAVGDARPDSTPAVVQVELGPVELDSAAQDVRGPREGLHDVRRAGSQLTSEAEDLATTEREVHCTARAGDHEVACLQDDLAETVGAIRVEVAELAADHHRHDLVHREVPDLLGWLAASVAEDDHLVGDLEDLAESVGDVDDAPTLGGQPLDHREDPLDLRI